MGACPVQPEEGPSACCTPSPAEGAPPWRLVVGRAGERPGDLAVGRRGRRGLSRWAGQLERLLSHWNTPTGRDRLAQAAVLVGSHWPRDSGLPVPAGPHLTSLRVSSPSQARPELGGFRAQHLFSGPYLSQLRNASGKCPQEASFAASEVAGKVILLLWPGLGRPGWAVAFLSWYLGSGMCPRALSGYKEGAGPPGQGSGYRRQDSARQCVDEGVTGRPGGPVGGVWFAVGHGRKMRAGWVGALVTHLCLPPGLS